MYSCVDGVSLRGDHDGSSVVATTTVRRSWRPRRFVGRVLASEATSRHPSGASFSRARTGLPRMRARLRYMPSPVVGAQEPRPAELAHVVLLAGMRLLVTCAMASVRDSSHTCVSHVSLFRLCRRVKVAVQPGRGQGYVAASGSRRRNLAESRMASDPTLSLGGRVDWGGAGGATGASSSMI
jgi:hypothetical protein